MKETKLPIVGMDAEQTVRTDVAGKSYRATFHDTRITFLLDAEEGMVHLFTPLNHLGLYRIERFGGSLSPDSIRSFLGSLEV